MLALLPPISDMFLWKVSEEWESWKREGPIDENRVKAIQRIFDSFLSDLNSFAEVDTPIQKQMRSYVPTAIEPLPASVRKEVTRLVHRLIEMLESCPSSSDISKQFRLNSQILGRLITRRYLSSDLSNILARHVDRRDIHLDVTHWHQFVLTAIEAGNKDDIARYHGKKAEALLRPDAVSSESQNRDENQAEQREGKDDSLEVRDVGKNKRLRYVADQISEMVISQDGQTLDELLETLEPYLDVSSIHPNHIEVEHQHHNSIALESEDENGRYSAFVPRKYNPHSIVQYAWSTLLHRSSRDQNISTGALLNMADTLPSPALIGHTFTPVMHGLVKRGEPLRAWELWLDLIEREKEASLRIAKSKSQAHPHPRPETVQVDRTREGLFIDRVTLGVATEACYAATHDLQAAVTLVDTWAYKPRFQSHFPDVVDERSTTSSVPDLTGSIQLDTQNLNILFNLCRLENQFVIAHKLWQAALPRYGIYHDDISLNLLLDIARYSDRDSDLDGQSALGTGAMSTGVDDGEMFRRRLRAMADEFGFRRRSKTATRSGSEGSAVGTTEEPETVGSRYGSSMSDVGVGSQRNLAAGPTSVLLEDDGSIPAGSFNSGKDALPWQRARDIFRQVVLGNWPHLESVKSPLEAAHTGPLESIVSFFGGSNDSGRSRSRDGAHSSHSPSIEPKSERQNLITPDVTTLNIPSATCKYPHVIPTSSTFRSYIALLGYNNLHSEIPIALAWMKELGIKPNWSTMCLALLHICEAEGPRRWVKGFGGNSSKSKRETQRKQGDVGDDAEGEGQGVGEGEEQEAIEDRSGYGLARDEEIVRRWLQDWLGHGWEQEKDTQNGANEKTTKRRRIVPTEQDVAYSRRWLAQRRKRLTA
ncbi:hypothetical protein I317_00097 [Kwoniella heveanensis CBS 569]|nr:hypothetical protein I317_00097 [Kwoniella heveanensis CBS 569]